MEVDIFLSRDNLNDLFFDIMEFNDPVELTKISWDDMSDGVYFTVEISDRDAIKHETEWVDIEA